MRRGWGGCYRLKALPSRLPTHPWFERSIGDETVVGQDMSVKRSDGELIPVLVSAAPVKSEDGARLGAVMTLSDITARRALERQKDEFFAKYLT